jgi:hypothetical protein
VHFIVKIPANARVDASTVNGGMTVDGKIQLSMVLRSFAPQDPGSWAHVIRQAETFDRAGVDRLAVSDHVVFGEDLDAYGRPEIGGQAGGSQPTGPDGHWLEPITLLSRWPAGPPDPARNHVRSRQYGDRSAKPQPRSTCCRAEGWTSASGWGGSERNTRPRASTSTVGARRWTTRWRFATHCGHRCAPISRRRRCASNGST